MKTAKEIAPLLAGYFKDRPVIRAYLFGSIARNEADEQSDIDVLVDLDYANGGDSFKTWCIMEDDLQNMFRMKVDLVSSDGLSRFVKPHIDRDKILIYEKQYR